MSENPFKKKYGPCVLVVGAAEGLGEAYTLALAKRGLNIIMVDNQAESLSTLDQRVTSELSIETMQLHIDLRQANAVEEIMNKIQNIECRLLIYNAAYSLIKPFVNHTEEELDNFIDINARNQVKLVHRFAQYLISKEQSGGMILMSSLAGLIGMQLVAPYAATKAFTWNLSEALHHELKDQKIDVMACIAGATATPAYLKTDPTYGLIKPTVMKPDKVAEDALKNLGKRTLFIPGFANRLNYFILIRLLPRKWASSVANNTMKSMYS